jgi:yecA family protein
MTRYEAYVEKSWREHGLAHVVVVRNRPDGLADFGMFQVDLWCLGVKEAQGETDVPQEALQEFLADHVNESNRESIHPACAKKLIEGAIAYAEKLGFAPHRDFRKARRVLSSLDAELCPTEFTYGHDGRPHFVRDEDDSDERVARILAILRARVGPEGFDYEDFDYEDGITELRKNLMEWLEEEPDEVPRFYALSGMITALHVCPGNVPPTELIEALWSEAEERVWADKAELQEFTDLFTDYWNYIADRVRDAAAPDADQDEQPIDMRPEDLPEDDPLPMAAASMEWALGFMRTTELWPDEWGDALERPELAPHWEVVGWWANFIDEANRDRIADAAEGTPSRTMAKSIIALARALRPVR